MNRMTKIFLPAALCMALILAPSGTPAASDVNLSVTIAVGGAVACGGVLFCSLYCEQCTCPEAHPNRNGLA